MNRDIIKQYLVELGYEVDQPTLNKFNDALRSTAAQVAKFTGGMTTAFVEAGVAVVGALSSVAIGTVALMESTAKADLGYQLFARRMFMSADAAKQLKIATDALGYSLEDVIWGPPELRERYHQLVEDQKRLQQGLGGAGFEQEMRKLRDIEFEFTRMKVEAQYFVMNLVKALSVALTGDENGLLQKLRQWNEWLIANIPRLSGEFATYLVPVLRDVKAVWTDIAEIIRMVASEFIAFAGLIYDDASLKTGEVNLRNLGRALDDVSGSVKNVMDYFVSFFQWTEDHPYFVKGLLGAALGGRVGGPWGAAIGLGAGLAVAAGEEYGKSGVVGGGTVPSSASGAGMSAEAVKAAIVASARSYGVDPALALAIAQKESGMNPAAARGAAGEYGMMQIMPETARAYGGDPTSFTGNLDIAMRKLRDESILYRGDERMMAERYNGSGPMARSYAADVMQKAERGYDVGGQHITINVYAQTNASPEQIAAHARRELEAWHKKTVQRQIVQGTGPQS